jgi:serine/threonine protein kinase/photosystem II stability/assembly factor-like uncharacterized protein
MSHRAPSSSLAPGQLVGPYRIVGKLGQGGMGAVYRAIHTQIERTVAIKVLHAEFARDPQVAQRFLNEARAVNRVRHPSLVQISDYGQLAGGEPYIIMEFLEGQTLTAYLQHAARAEGGQGKLPPALACALCREIALGILAAHDKGIVHRDLKPDNVMLVADPRRPGALQVKLLDFGIAKLLPSPAAGPGLGEEPSGPGLEGEATQVGMLLGTPAYMSPEQVRGDGTVGAPSDVYALGVMLYQMLGGALPFTGPATGVLAKHLYEEPPPLAQLAPELPEELAALTHRMLAKDPAARPSMAEVAAALRATARQHRGTELSHAPVLRHRLLTVGGAAALVLGSLGVWSALRERAAPLAVPLAPQQAGPGGCSADGWCRLATPVTYHLRGVTVSPQERSLWISGDQGTILQGLVGPRGEGTTFTRVQSGTTQKLLAVTLAPGGLLLAVGEQGTLLAGPRAAAPELRLVPLSTQAYLTAIQVGAGGQLWVTGKGGTLLSGHVERLSALEPVPLPTSENLYGLHLSPGGDAGGSAWAWAVGRDGVALCYEQGAWRQVPTGSRSQLKGIWGAAPDDVWAVGKEGTLLHFDGRAFSRQRTGTTDLNAIAGTRRDRIFIVGDQGTILRYQAGAFVPMASGVTEDLSGISVSEDEAWAVGDGGAVLRLRQP